MSVCSCFGCRGSLSVYPALRSRTGSRDQKRKKWSSQLVAKVNLWSRALTHIIHYSTVLVPVDLYFARSIYDRSIKRAVSGRSLTCVGHSLDFLGWAIRLVYLCTSNSGKWAFVLARWVLWLLTLLAKLLRRPHKDRTSCVMSYVFPSQDKMTLNSCPILTEPGVHVEYSQVQRLPKRSWAVPDSMLGHLTTWED